MTQELGMFSFNLFAFRIFQQNQVQAFMLTTQYTAMFPPPQPVTIRLPAFQTFPGKKKPKQGLEMYSPVYAQRDKKDLQIAP